MGHCEDYPCCGHTDGDPCPGRGTITEPWYCDQCGYDHSGKYLTCPADDGYDEGDDDE